MMERLNQLQVEQDALVAKMEKINKGFSLFISGLLLAMIAIWIFNV